MLLLGVDLETTGLDPQSEHIIEVGAVLWDTDSNKPIKMISEFVKIDNEVDISNQITEITRITKQDCQKFGMDIEDIFDGLEFCANLAEYKVAYNADFEESFLKNGTYIHN